MGRPNFLSSLSAQPSYHVQNLLYSTNEIGIYSGYPNCLGNSQQCMQISKTCNAIILCIISRWLYLQICCTIIMNKTEIEVEHVLSIVLCVATSVSCWHIKYGLTPIEPVSCFIGPPHHSHIYIYLELPTSTIMYTV